MAAINQNQNPDQKPISNQNEYLTYDQMNLINNFRSLWSETIIWLRSFIFSTVTGFSDITSIKNRLSRIPEKFQAQLQPYLGMERAGQFQQLVSSYLINAEALFTAEKTKGQQEINSALVELYKSSDDIAEFLAKITPYWSRNQWQYLLYHLNEMLVADMVALMTGEFDKEIDIRDRMLKHSFMLGDYMASGIMYYSAAKRTPAVRINQNPNEYITYGQMNLINDFRSLWTEVVIWLRSFIVSMVSGFGNTTAISNRIYRIPGEVREKLEPFLGADLSEKFQNLLLMLLVHAQSYISAEVGGNQAAANAAATALFKDADDIADFLASINPYWDKSQWQYLLYQLIELGISEVLALNSGEYEKEIGIRDTMLQHALVLGDYMARGLMHYLVPEKFSSGQRTKSINNSQASPFSCR